MKKRMVSLLIIVIFCIFDISLCYMKTHAIQIYEKEQNVLIETKELVKRGNRIKIDGTEKITDELTSFHGGITYLLGEKTKIIEEMNINDKSYRNKENVYCEHSIQINAEKTELEQIVMLNENIDINYSNKYR